ncbi:MAG: hypothetical protein D6706_17095 [Chloroflexi bacterium]|nr:MAG: hypothetical protein D6706_17095 [Chloroflexota bacterium]
MYLPFFLEIYALFTILSPLEIDVGDKTCFDGRDGWGFLVALLLVVGNKYKFLFDIWDFLYII